MFGFKLLKRKPKRGYASEFRGNQYVRSFRVGSSRLVAFMTMAWLYLSSLVLAVLIVAGFAYMLFPFEAEAEPEVIEKVVTVYKEGTNLRDMQDQVLAELAECESGSVKEQDGAIILDTNNRMSIGRYMWQRESVILYYKELYGKDVTRREAIEISVDPDRSAELTRDVLFGTEDGYVNWLNCSKKIALKTKVDWIKKFME